MTIHLEEFIEALAILADKESVQLTLKQSGKGALICGGITFVGGLLAGPIGLAIGGTLGGLTAYKLSSGFHTLGHIMRYELTRYEQQRMLDHIKAAVSDLNAMDVISITMLLRGGNSINGLILQEGIKFILGHTQRYVESNHQKTN